MFTNEQHDSRVVSDHLYMSTIGFNPTTLQSLHQYTRNQSQTGTSFERLSTGLAINRASDNPSGLIASNAFSARLSSIDAQIYSGQRANSQLSIRDGAISAQLENLDSSILDPDIDPVVAQASINAQREELVLEQAHIGIEQREQESMQRVLENEQINVAQARSSIRDTDYAKEYSSLVKSQILEQASIYTLNVNKQSQLNSLILLDVLA